MGLSGGFDELNDAQAALQALDGMPERVAQRAAVEIASVLDEQFEAGVDPYGDPWADLKRGGRSHLTETGAMHAGSTVHARGSDIVIHVPDPGGFHQTGTRYMVARPLEPVAAKGMPPAYEVALMRAASDEGLT